MSYRNSSLLLAGVVSLVAGQALAADIQIDVTPANMGNWAAYSTDSSGTINTGSNIADIVTGPATPPVGTGSAHFQTAPGSGDESAQLRLTVPNTGILLSSLTELKYSTYVPTPADYNGQQVPWLTLWIDTDGDFSGREDRIRFEPAYSDAGAGNGNPFPQADIATGVWQQWDALGGMWYDDNSNGTPGSGAITWSAMLTALGPAATLINDPGQLIGGLRVASGFSSPGDNYNTNVDAFRIATGGDTTLYNFDPDPVPEPASLSVLGVAAAFTLARRRKT